jgi:hypothetical protein
MKQVVKNFNRSIKNINKKLPQRLNWWQMLILLVVSLLVCFTCDHFGVFEYALPLLGTLLAEIVVIFIKREIWGEWWFWLVLVILLPAQFYGLRYCAHLYAGYSGPSRGPIGGIAVVNFFALLGATHLMELMVGYKEKC